MEARRRLQYGCQFQKHLPPVPHAILRLRVDANDLLTPSPRRRSSQSIAIRRVSQWNLKRVAGPSLGGSCHSLADVRHTPRPSVMRQTSGGGDIAAFFSNSPLTLKTSVKSSPRQDCDEAHDEGLRKRTMWMMRESSRNRMRRTSELERKTPQTTKLPKITCTIVRLARLPHQLDLTKKDSERLTIPQPLYSSLYLFYHWQVKSKRQTKNIIWTTEDELFYFL